MRFLYLKFQTTFGGLKLYGNDNLLSPQTKLMNYLMKFSLSINAHINAAFLKKKNSFVLTLAQIWKL